MKTKILLLLVLVVFLVSPFKGKAQTANVQDSLALVDLYDSTGGPGWINHINWLTKAPVSTWFGVTTDTGRVNTLTLTHNKLVGTIPASLGNLSAIFQIFLDNNQLRGSIPSSLSNLSNMRSLRLQNNQLSGAVPASLYSLQWYVYIGLENNNLTFSGLEQSQQLPFMTFYPQSDIPLIVNNGTYSVAAGGTVGNNTYKWYRNDTLVATKVGNSTFMAASNGEYSVQVTNSQVPNLTLYSIENANPSDSLAMVDIYNSTKGNNWINNINWLTTAPLATWYGLTVRKKAVSSVTLSGNNLSGNVPQSVGSLLNATSIDLGGNLLTGTIPLSIGSLLNATSISLSGNNLTGTIPTSIGALSNTSHLNFSSNSLTGTIPGSIGKLENLIELELGGNNLTGGLPDSLQYLSKLGILGLSNNQFSGSIPYFLGNISSLYVLDLSYNNFKGQIPDSLSKLSNLDYLYLTNNQLTGNIPASLAKLSNLNNLHLDNNQLTGPIPGFLGIMTSLGDIELSHNQFSGPLPDSLCHSNRLSRLYISSNQLTGTLDSLATTPQLGDLDLSDNLFSGSLPYFAYPYSLGNFNIATNKFTFNGMQNLPTIAQHQYIYSLQYAPQRNIPYIKNGSHLSVSAGGILANDTFRLYKDGALQATQAGDSVFTIQGLGRYNITVTNPVAPLLTLTSDTLALLGDSLILPARPNTEYASYEYTDTAGWTHYYYNNNTPNDLTDDTLLLSLKKNSQDIGTVGDGTFAVKLVATAGAGGNNGVHLTNPLITNTSGYWVMNRYWQVTPTHEPAKSVGVRFYYNNQDLKDVNGSYPTHNLTNNKLIFYKAVGGNPDPTSNLTGATKIISILPGTAASDTSWTYHALSDTSQYGEYSVAGFSGGGGGGTGNNQALPVVLINFTASLLKNDAQLNWQTSQEINAGDYTVERSLTNTGFAAIGKVAAAGNSTITQSYKFTDYNTALLNTTALYYRLKITDKDGNFTYSKVIKIDIGGANNVFVVYPNPTQNTATIVFKASAAGKYAIEITDLEGKTVKRMEGTSSAGVNTIPVYVHGYAQGAYIIKIEGEYVSKQSLKLVKQ